MKKTLLFAIALLLSISSSYAQNDVYLSITHKLGSANFAFNQPATNNINQNFVLSRVQYYISSIKIIHDGGMETNVSNKYILVNGSSNVNELLGNFSVTNVEGIKFSIGVESPANNADPTLYPPAHPLAPKSPSMHWGWSSGYRFVALEGMAGSSFNTMFQMHGLWNANYFEQTQMAAGVNSGNGITINLDADYVEAVGGVNIQSGPIDHGANATDLAVLQNFRDHVFSPSSGNTSVPHISENTNISIYPNPSASTLYIDNSNSDIKANRVIIIDAIGKTVLEQELHQLANQIQLKTKGAYTAVLFNENELLGRQLVLIQ
ncbi:MAG: T9SS type A sorting domain-containing protein [Ignavibacteria bacterium]|nr:T9SS type A sorting domain-containing protein [Ignavibacteria bacterium]